MLKELAGSGWVLVDPPLDRDPSSVIARYKGEPIKAGFTMEEDEAEDELYFKFRSGRYDMELKVDFNVGHGQLRVNEADGYE